MFDYSRMAWEDLKYSYIHSKQINLHFFSLEYHRDVLKDEAYPNYPFYADLEVEAKASDWIELASKASEVTAHRLVESLSLKLRSQIDKLGYLERTITFTRKAQNIINGLMPTLQGAMLSNSELYLMAPLERAKFMETMVNVYTKLNTIEKQSIGLGDPAEVLKKIMANFGEGMTIEQVSAQISEMGDTEITNLFDDIVKAQTKV